MRLLFATILAVSCSAFAQTYTIQTYAGGGLPVNVAAVSVSLGDVYGLAVDKDGNTFVALYNYNTVVRVDAGTGVLTRVGGNGTAGYSGDNGPATSAQLQFPSAVAVDASGNVYIADTGNNCVRKVSGGDITTVAGNGTSGYNGDNITATNAQLSNPTSVAVDSSGNLYIADTNNNRVRKVSGGIITTVAGTGVHGYNGDGIAATSAQLASPFAVAVDGAGDLLYIGDNNQRVREVSGGTITTVAGHGLASNGTCDYNGDNIAATVADLCAPTGLALDSAGNIYIADQGGNRVRKVSGGVIATVAGNGTAGYSGDNGPATDAQITPVGVAVDPSGDVYIGDWANCRVRKVSEGIIITVAGGGGVGDGGPAGTAELALGGGVAVDASGNLFIADTYNDRIREISNGTVTTIAGNGNWFYNGDGIPATSAQLFYPEGVALDSSGDIYIAEFGGDRVRRVSNGSIATVAGTGIFGYNGDSIAATSAELGNPLGLAVDSSGNLYISDSENWRVRKVSGGVITTVAGNGEFGYSGDGGPALSAQLGYITDVAVDSSGNLYIADLFNNVIRKVSNGLITTAAGTGAAGFGGDGGPASAAKLSGPWGVATDASGNLYIGDSGNNRVRKVSGGVITTIGGTGVQAFGGDGGPASSAQLDAPSGVVVDSSGNVYVTDIGDNRVRVLAPSGPSCAYTVNPLTLAATASGGSLPVAIQAASGCTWAIQSLPDWVTFSGNAVSSGPGTVSLTVAANTGAARSAQISIAGLSVTVNQASGVLLVNTGGVVNGASYTAPVVPGSIAAIFGNFLLPAPVEVSAFPVPTNLGGLSFQFSDGTLAPLFYANVGQVNAQVPWELEGQSHTTITATINGQISAPQTVSLATYAPGVFAVNSEGTGQGAILDANYHLVDASNPAIPDQTTILIYCTGLGPVSGNQPATGAPASLTNLAHTSSPVTATIGGVLANVTFSGLAPGYVGLYQVNAQVPAGLAANDAVPVMISIGGVQSNSVTIAVQ